MQRITSVVRSYFHLPAHKAQPMYAHVSAGPAITVPPFIRGPAVLDEAAIVYKGEAAGEEGMRLEDWEEGDGEEVWSNSW